VILGGQWVGLGLGDSSPEIRKIKDFMRRMYRSYAGGLADTELYDQQMVNVVLIMQGKLRDSGKLPADKVNGVIGASTKYAMGYLKKDVILPLYFSAEGHMSDMWVGPVSWVGQVLQSEGRALHFPTYYENRSIPFKTQTGINEMARRIGQTVQDTGDKFPPGTPFAMGGFSEGAMVTYGVYTQYLAPGKPLNWRLKDLRGVISAGSPHREKGVCATWIPDAPPADHQGLSDERMVNTPWWWLEIARKGDLYSDNQSSGDRALFKTSIYKIIAKGQFSGGPAGFLARVMDLLSPADDLLPLALSIFDAMKFGVNMSVHGIYPMDPAVQFMRERLAA
jgi:hypothetical protein